ncbi:uncharacterized protein [Cicer arietinum]|uniref:Uncharacterized protein LOC101503636 n=1 Tax=Cicer arietinum TaxID=3827 RepID=A0A1S2YCL4_CICAR|nr:uncharacterized protein LOC101503636 [Cicer arietinum]
MKVSQDNAYEIFSWLQAKTICKFKSCCKSFSKFLEESDFKTKQANNLLKKDDTCFFIQPGQIEQRYKKIVELHTLLKEKQSSGIPNNVLKFLSKSASVLSSSNGLILCCTISDQQDPIELFICNPITKSRSFIPTPKSLQGNYPYVDINIMLDCSNGSSYDYKIFLFENTIAWSPTCYICKVYDGKEGVWKTMKNNFFSGGRNMKFDMSVLHNGVIYFISDCSPYFGISSPFYMPYIMSYNLENGISTILRLPEEATKGCNENHVSCDMGIFKWGKVTNPNQSICLVRLRECVFNVWFLKDYESSLWESVLEVRVRALGLKEKDPNVRVFMVMNGDLLIFATKNKVYSCGLSNERFMVVEEICEHSCGYCPRLISYSNTLRLCGTNAAPLPC